MHFVILFLVTSYLRINQPQEATSGNKKNDGWQQLFNGKDLTGWKHVGPGYMTVDSGLTQTHGGMGLLYWTGGKVGNCTIRVVFRMRDENDNSGIFICSPYAAGLPSKLRTEYEAKWYKENAPAPGKEPLYDEVFYRGHDYDDMKPHLLAFFEAVKSRQPVVEDAVFGNHAALACHMANESYFRQKTVFWDESSRSIRD